MRRTETYAAMIPPVESASPSRAARLQQGEDEAQSRASRGRWTFYEAIKDDKGQPTTYVVSG
jgi:hypothetical protein